MNLGCWLSLRLKVAARPLTGNRTGRSISGAAERIRQKAINSSKKRVVLAEGDDRRVCEAALSASKQGIADITLLRPASSTEQSPPGLHDWVDVLAPEEHPKFEQLCAEYCDRRWNDRMRKQQSRGLTVSAEKESAAKRADREDAASPLFFANLLVRDGQACGSVAGAAHSSGSTVSSALRCIGLAEGVQTLSSFFVMDFPGTSGTLGAKTMIFADCCVVVEPTAAQLAEIAIDAASAAREFLPVGENESPRVALLSFSTKGSSAAPQGLKVQDALAEIGRRCAADEGIAIGAHFDGDLQLDAAIVPDIAEKKAPGSTVAGAANVLVFPSLEAGNIGYKLAERFGGATAIGPVLMGLAAPANDLSRGCSVDDVIDVIAVTAVQGSLR